MVYSFPNMKIKIILRKHPFGPNPYVPGAHRSHRLPTTFFLHMHWPPRLSQFVLNEPVGSHEHSRILKIT